MQNSAVILRLSKLLHSYYSVVGVVIIIIITKYANIRLETLKKKKKVIATSHFFFLLLPHFLFTEIYFLWYTFFITKLPSELYQV
jgi:hypothetical protein